MNAENLIGFVIYFATAAIMVGIGTSQLRSSKPVGFYTGEKPPGEDEITDVKTWNKKHGLMWMIYGGSIITGFGIGTLSGDSLWCLIPMLGGVLLPLPVMIWYHHRLIRLCKR